MKKVLPVLFLASMLLGANTSFAMANTAPIYEKAFNNSGITSVKISTVSAVNGAITVTLSGIDPRWQTISQSSMFKITRSINGGPETSVAASLIGGGFVNNKLTGYAKVPVVLPTNKSQSVVYRVSFNGGPAVAAKAFTVFKK
jgi:hypothetical protein